MALWLVIVASVLLVAVVSLSLYGASVLPRSADLPMHYGLGGYTSWRPRTVVLWTWPAISAVLYVILVATVRGQDDGGGSSVPLGLAVAMAVLLVNQAGALRAAIRLSGRRPGRPSR
ncbi:MAG TPA: hypothetical protein VF843_15465 [Streptosporangiaceae bacterium]